MNSSFIEIHQLKIATKQQSLNIRQTNYLVCGKIVHLCGLNGVQADLAEGYFYFYCGTSVGIQVMDI